MTWVFWQIHGQSGLLFRLHQGQKVEFQGQEGRSFWGGVGARFIVIEEGKWRFLGRAMGGRIMVEFGSREELCPWCGVIGTKDTKISLKFLIGSFNLTISLGVIGSGQSNVIFQKISQFSCKDRSELRTLIRDECVIKAKVFEDIVEEDLSDSTSINGLWARS